MKQNVFAYVVILILCLQSGIALSQEVNVKYRGIVSLKPFNCYELKESSLVKDICYDKSEKYLLVNLKGTFYHYCDIPNSVVSDWLSSNSLGRFYNSSVKGNYDCRYNYMPLYE
jgi:hypothetical protein